jgi:biotin transport system permease protein
VQTVAAYVRSLDPRLKLLVALVLGACLWRIDIVLVLICALSLLAIVRPLAAIQPIGSKMVRSLLFFVLFWVGIKIFLDLLSGMPLVQICMDAGELAARLAALLMVGLSLALSTSARSLGLAVSWIICPLIGKERAWQVALSLALMIHFLPMCLTTMSQVKETAASRCPQSGFRQRLNIVPQAVIRNLSQKTWNQTLAVASRRLDDSSSWEPDFDWSGRDWLCSILCAIVMLVMFVV